MFSLRPENRVSYCQLLPIFTRQIHSYFDHSQKGELLEVLIKIPQRKGHGRNNGCTGFTQEIQRLMSLGTIIVIVWYSHPCGLPWLMAGSETCCFSLPSESEECTASADTNIQELKGKIAVLNMSTCLALECW